MRSSVSFVKEVLHLARALTQMAVKNCFIRGSVVRYVQLPAEHVDTQLLEDATRRGGANTFLFLNAPHLGPFLAQRPPTRRSGDECERQRRH